MTISTLTIGTTSDTLTKRKFRYLPRLGKKYVAAICVILLICIGVAIYLATAERPKPPELWPPNPEVPLPASPSKLRVFRKAAVCTDAAPCSSIGRDILARNGSAVDATLAAMFCNGIVNMQSMGLGGSFLMTIYTRETQTAITLNAREAAPLKSTPDMFKDDYEKSVSGPLAVGVPGELRGYWEAHKRFGKLPWKDLIMPSINLCENGYNMTLAQWGALSAKKNVKNDPLLREWFVDPATNNFKKGTLIKPTQLCKTLRIIAENGGDDLYNGTLSKMLVDDIQAMGGIITRQDLEIYRAKWEEPVTVKFNNNHTLYSVSPPGSGILLGFMLKILDGYNFSNKSIDGLNNTIQTYHRIIETFKYAYAKRTELGDSALISMGSADGVGFRSGEIIKNLTSNEYTNYIREQINDTATSNDPKHYGAVFYNQPDHGTAHISVIAPNGDAVSVTSTVNTYFGAGITSKSTGIILNSGMDDFSSPGFSNYFGLPGSPANAIQPQKRPLSSMSPTIVTDANGDTKIVIGAAGGTKITTAVALVIIRYLWFGQDIKQAVDAPRFHHQLYPMSVDYEYGNLEQIVEGWKEMGHKTHRYSDRGSVICALVKTAENIIANADYRKGGDVFGID